MSDARRERATVGQWVGWGGGGRGKKMGISPLHSCVGQLNTSNPRARPPFLVVFTLGTAA